METLSSGLAPVCQEIPHPNRWAEETGIDSNAQSLAILHFPLLYTFSSPSTVHTFPL